MRVIAGNKRGMKLSAPEGEHTRPTLDRTKETLFNVLMPYVMDSCFLDLFSGSGGIAIEALSRGAKMAALAENDRRALECIKFNLNKAGFDKKEARVFPGDVYTAMDSMCRDNLKFGLVFMDPPYNMGLEKKALIKLKECSLLTKEAIVVVEASLDTDFSYLKEISYGIWKRKKYKTSQHLFLEELTC